MNDLLIPGLTLICGLAGGFAGARSAIVRLETQMEGVLKEVIFLRSKVERHARDLLVHDMEIEQALLKLDVSRVRRQVVDE